MTSARQSLRLSTIAAPAVLFASALSGCAPSPQPTADCGAAFDIASAQIEVLYATHPFYGPEYDALYADGTVTDDEQAQLDAWLADENAQYERMIDPIYDACQGIEDFYLGAYSQGDRADWGLQGTPAISTEDLKSIFLSSYCSGREQRQACSDFKAEDWD